MIRIAKFLGIFLLVAVSLFGGIYWLNKSAIDAVLRNDLSEGTEYVPLTYSLKGLVEYLGTDPDSYSLVSIRADKPDSSIYFNAETRRSLGNLAHLMLIASYVDAVHSGVLDSTTLVDVSLLEQFRVPNFEPNRFRSDLNDLRKLGQPTINNLVYMLAENNNTVFADYLYYMLGVERVNNIPSRFNTDAIEAPLPWSGVVTAWDPRVHNRPFEMLHGEYANMCDTCYHQKITEMGNRYMTDAAWRDSVAVRIGSGDDILFTEEKIRNRYTTRAIPQQFALFMAEIVHGQALGDQAQNHLARILSWPMKNAKTTRDFDRYMAIYDSRMGYLAGVDFGILPGETQPVSQVFIMENIPVGLFMHLSSNLMTQDFQQRLIWDPELAKVAFENLNRSTLSQVGLSQIDHLLNRQSVE
jgi:hypothetical protein